MVGAIVVLLGALLLALWLWVNPDNYKNSISAAVKESTGRDLRLSGAIKLSVFPWLALQVGPANLANSPGFGDEPILSLTHATLRVRLLPLLRRRLEVTRVEIDGLDLRLRRNAQGQGNWQDVWVKPEASSSVRADKSPPRPPAAPPDLRIRSGAVSYPGLRVENLNLETGPVAQQRDMPVHISFDAQRGEPGEKITVDAKFDLNWDSVAREMRFAAVNLAGTLSRPDDERPVHWDFAAPLLVVNPWQMPVQAAAFTLNYSGAHLTGSVAAAKLFDDLNMTGSLTLAPLPLREFAPRVGMAVPQTKDPKAWSQLSGSTDFAYAAGAWSFNKLQVHLDDTQAQGNIKFAPAETDILEFDLAADRIDLDRYRTVASAAGRDAKMPDPSRDKARKPFQAHGTLTALSAHWSGMEFDDLRVSVASKQGVTHLFPIEAQIDGGRYSGDITLDERSAVRIVSVDEHLIRVDMARLLARSAQKGRVSGRATINLKGTAHGEDMDAFLKTLSGHLDADLEEGALEGIDLEYERNRAQALIDRTPAPRDDTKRTPFDAFTISADITNGIAQTHDLTISTPALRITGQGSANLSSKAINFQLLASILKAPGKTLVDIPLKVTGTYADPAVKADIDSLVKDQLKQKLKDILKKNGLQGLFGK